MEILKNASNLISIFIFNEINKSKYSFQAAIINKMIDISKENILIVDNIGMVNNCSPSIQEMFPFCDLYTNSISQILPDNIVNWILNSQSQGKKYVITDNFKGHIINFPIIFNDKISSFIVTLKSDINHKIKDNKVDHLDNIITKNSKMLEIKRKIKKLANSPSSVLITGDTGTGKEMIAKAIHFTSNRKSNPFVPINCANIPNDLFESELFGYEEGAFTGAKTTGKIGIFELANGGTVFLDEIGELPIHLQAKLLRVLQENVIQRLGSIVSISIDVRIIVATNQDLQDMIAKKQFRKDLYYRLNVIPIKLPLLLERTDDIKLLAYHFLDKYNNILNKKISSISSDTINLLKNYTWPGNIRELENTIEYAVNMEESSIVTRDSLPYNIRESRLNKLDTIASNKESQVILSTLEKHGWSVAGKKSAAEELGISLRTLYRRLKDI